MKFCYPMSEMREERIADRGYRNSELIDSWLVSYFILFYFIFSLMITCVWRGSEFIPLSPKLYE